MSFPVPSPFAWDATFDVKSPSINEQHKQLFDLINALDADRDSPDKLGALLNFVVLHFQHEERLFTEKSYGDAAAHKQVHDKFLEDAKALTHVGEGEMQFIKSWLVQHIKETDMKYADVLKGC